MRPPRGRNSVHQEITGLLLTTEAVVVEKTEDEPMPPMPGGSGGMGGMY